MTSVSSKIRSVGQARIEDARIARLSFWGGGCCPARAAPSDGLFTIKAETGLLSPAVLRARAHFPKTVLALPSQSAYRARIVPPAG